MRPSLLLIDLPRLRAAMLATLPVDLFELRAAASTGDAWEALYDERADVVFLGSGVERGEAVAFIARLRAQFPRVIGLLASGDRILDAQSLQLAGDHVDACAELRRRIVEAAAPAARLRIAVRAARSL